MVSEAIREAATRLVAISDTARLDAEVLMAHALGVSRSDLLLRHLRDPAPAGFASLVKRRTAQEPVAYITGEQEFFGLRLRVSPEVLIPRGDSEVLVERALTVNPSPGRVLDCGTGSGALLLATLAHLPRAQGVGIDRSEGALAIARANAEALGLADRTRLLTADWTCADWIQGLGGPFDLVLANPPYVETKAELAASVRAFEPAGALFAGVDGLDDYRVLVPQLAALLAPAGVALLEIGHTQGAAVREMAQELGWRAEVHPDLGGRDRVVEISMVL